MRPFHPDDTGMIPRDKPGDKKPDGKPDGKGKPDDMLNAFFPGQMGAIARQLNSGFGGGLKDWRQSIRAPYAPFRSAISFPYGRLGGGAMTGRPDAPVNPAEGFSRPGEDMGQMPIDEYLRLRDRGR